VLELEVINPDKLINDLNFSRILWKKNYHKCDFVFSFYFILFKLIIFDRNVTSVIRLRQ